MRAPANNVYSCVLCVFFYSFTKTEYKRRRLYIFHMFCFASKLHFVCLFFHIAIYIYTTNVEYYCSAASFLKLHFLDIHNFLRNSMEKISIYRETLRQFNWLWGFQHCLNGSILMNGCFLCFQVELRRFEILGLQIHRENSSLYDNYAN